MGERKGPSVVSLHKDSKLISIYHQQKFWANTVMLSSRLICSRSNGMKELGTKSSRVLKIRRFVQTWKPLKAWKRLQYGEKVLVVSSICTLNRLVPLGVAVLQILLGRQQ